MAKSIANHHPLRWLLLAGAGLMGTAGLFLALYDAPPTLARLLPEGDVVAFADVRRLQGMGLPLPELFPGMAGIGRDVDADLDFDADVDAIAISIRHEPRRRILAVIQQHASPTRFMQWLQSQGGRPLDTGDLPAWELRGNNARRLWVLALGPEQLVLTDDVNPGVFQEIIRHYHQLAMPFRGPLLLRRFADRIDRRTAAFLLIDYPQATATGGGRPELAGSRYLYIALCPENGGRVQLLLDDEASDEPAAAGVRSGLSDLAKRYGLNRVEVTELGDHVQARAEATVEQAGEAFKTMASEGRSPAKLAGAGEFKDLPTR